MRCENGGVCIDVKYRSLTVPFICSCPLQFGGDATCTTGRESPKSKNVFLFLTEPQKDPDLAPVFCVMCTFPFTTAAQTTRWGDWSEWSPCTVTCGEGWRSRSRKCLDETGGEAVQLLCVGSSFETEKCTFETCPGVHKIVFVKRTWFLVTLSFTHATTNQWCSKCSYERTKDTLQFPVLSGHVTPVSFHVVRAQSGSSGRNGRTAAQRRRVEAALKPSRGSVCTTGRQESTVSARDHSR